MFEETPDHKSQNESDGIAGKLLMRGGLLGNYVLVAEVLYEDRVELQVAVSANTSPWTIAGMINGAMEIIAMNSPDIAVDEDEDGSETG